MAKLEQEQEEILAQMVEAQRGLPRQGRSHFLLVQSSGGDSLIHPKLRIDAFKGDLDALEMAGLIYVATIGGRGTPNYEIAPNGYEYYDEMKRRAGEPARQVEAEVVRFLESDGFRGRHPAAAAKWDSAVEKLWSPVAKKELTNIGHLCREAIQEFADDLVRESNLDFRSGN